MRFLYWLLGGGFTLIGPVGFFLACAEWWGHRDQDRSNRRKDTVIWAGVGVVGSGMAFFFWTR